MKNKINLALVTLIGLLLIACSGDDGTENSGPSFQISGEATLSGNWPSDGEVLVVMFAKTDVDQGIYGNALDFELLTSEDINYTFEDVSVGDYYLILSWKDPNDPEPSTNQHIFGYHGTNQPPYYTTVSMTEEDNLVEVNLSGNLELICDDMIVCFAGF